MLKLTPTIIFIALVASFDSAFVQTPRSSRNSAAREKSYAQLRIAVDQIYPETEKLYLHLHQNPELSFHAAPSITSFQMK